jgi:hypothetical protein
MNIPQVNKAAKPEDVVNMCPTAFRITRILNRLCPKTSRLGRTNPYTGFLEAKV